MDGSPINQPQGAADSSSLPKNYALIVVKGRAIGDLVLNMSAEPYTRAECEARLEEVLNDPSLASEGTRYGGACVLIQGEWGGSYISSLRTYIATQG